MHIAANLTVITIRTCQLLLLRWLLWLKLLPVHDKTNTLIVQKWAGNMIHLAIFVNTLLFCQTNHTVTVERLDFSTGNWQLSLGTVFKYRAYESMQLLWSVQWIEPQVKGCCWYSFLLSNQSRHSINLSFPICLASVRTSSPSAIKVTDKSFIMLDSSQNVLVSSMKYQLQGQSAGRGRTKHARQYSFSDIIKEILGELLVFVPSALFQ